jgi:adenine-specific DNA-methyltransferase
MPELQFKGKEFVYNHHLTVPFRPLEMDAKKSIGKPNLNGNLIIHGDNLHALKALLPLYAGKVDCVFIDPPYNTGNEGWNYNDNVNSPMIREWFSANPVNSEDMLRHDKWCAMMYPRLKLLHELLSENGSFWMTLDDNEIQHAREILDEVFGERNFLAAVCWQKKYAPANDKADFSAVHDYVLCYAKNRPSGPDGKAVALLNRMERTEKQDKAYKNPDSDPRGPWKPGDYTCNKTAELRPNLYYPLIHPKTKKEVWPSQTRVWAYDKVRHRANIEQKRVWWGREQENEVPSYKRFLSEVKGVVYDTWWTYEAVGHTDEAKKQIKEIFPEEENPFDTPKPIQLLERIIKMATNEDSIILDSFAGSGTTGHATLSVNSKDGGIRSFILVEQESYAHKLTAERIRRAINGYKFEGTQRLELLRESVTLNTLKNPDKLLKQVDSIENFESHRFDRIKREIKAGQLIVTGEKQITDKVEGLGDEFTFCTLGSPLDLDKILTGKSLPEYEAIGAWLFHTATGEPLDTGKVRKKSWYLGESSAYHVWLVYEADLDFLKSNKAALTLELAERIASDKEHKGRRHLVFAPAKYVPNKTLLPMRVEYAPLPFALYRVEKE